MLPIVDLKDSVNAGLPTGVVEPFAQRTGEMRRNELTELQINLGKLCNQTCTHCHVDAGPTKKRENMSADVADRIIELALATPGLRTVDMTGGAPEMNPNFQNLARTFRNAGLRVIDRCNLTILSEPGFEWVGDFLAQHQIDIVASLPCYLEDNVDGQRGDGVFHRSLAGLRRLNELGYGRGTSDSADRLKLDLVYNPTGPALPPDQNTLEADYHRELKSRYDIEFDSLYAITNIPIRRYSQYLKKIGRLEEYLRLLQDAFNPSAVGGVMCRSLVSISWDGKIYDCDFNQMIDLANTAETVWTVDSLSDFVNRPIALADHCYGCTAGAGSSCTGSLIPTN